MSPSPSTSTSTSRGSSPSPSPSPVASIDVALAERSYRIVVGRGLLDSAAAYADLPAAPAAVIVSNETVAPLYAERLGTLLAARHERVSTVVVADGEAHKTWATLQSIFDRLVEARCDRQTVLYALGGGVVGDLTGFAAACYMRGIAFVQVPTTLLAQVDSSVGGKTGINHPAAKNMIGAFHQPLRVVVDTATLATLPRRELVAGLAEVIKYGAVADEAFLSWLEANLEPLLALDEAAVVHAVTRSCRIKADIVAADERESGLRAHLNFGHTFGHAIEAGAGYGRWLHGEAVGCGMLMAADLSVRAGSLLPRDALRLAELVVRAGLPTRAPDLGSERYATLMQGDKKAAGGQTRFVLLDGLGRARVGTAAAADVAATVSQFTSG